MATLNQLNKGGISPALGFLAPTCYCTGDRGAVIATQGTDTTPVVTETYVSRVDIPMNTTITGLAILNGSLVAGNMILALTDSNGVVLAQTPSTVQAGAAAFQQVPFAAPLAVRGPGMYFLIAQFNNVGARFRSHTLGNFRAGKLTAQTYGTLPTFTPPTTFTANLGPVAETY